MDPALLTPLGKQFLSEMPLWLRDDPNTIAIQHALAKEHERLQAKIELTRDQFFPQRATVLLAAWEAMVKASADPTVTTDEQRQDRLMAMLPRMIEEASGLSWEEAITNLIGPVWSYQEHVEGDPSTPPAYTVRIVVPFAPASDLYMLTESFIRVITPANTDIQLQFEGGFLLDESQLDQEGLG